MNPLKIESRQNPTESNKMTTRIHLNWVEFIPLKFKVNCLFKSYISYFIKGKNMIILVNAEKHLKNSTVTRGNASQQTKKRYEEIIGGRWKQYTLR